jgi:single-strand DNA-binding protein
MNQSTHVNPSGINVVVLRGVMSTEPVSRRLPAGTCAVQFDVRTVLGESSSVPVSWIDPPASALVPLVVGEPVVVVGSVRRRFFRTGGSTQSRTEVVAERVVPERRAKSAQSAISLAIRSLGD